MSPSSFSILINGACGKAACDRETLHSDFVRLKKEVRSSRYGCLCAVGMSAAVEGE